MSGEAEIHHAIAEFRSGTFGTVQEKPIARTGLFPISPLHPFLRRLRVTDRDLMPGRNPLNIAIRTAASQPGRQCIGFFKERILGPGEQQHLGAGQVRHRQIIQNWDGAQ